MSRKKPSRSWGSPLWDSSACAFLLMGYISRMRIERCELSGYRSRPAWVLSVGVGLMFLVQGCADSEPDWKDFTEESKRREVEFIEQQMDAGLTREQAQGSYNVEKYQKHNWRGGREVDINDPEELKRYMDGGDP